MKRVLFGCLLAASSAVSLAFAAAIGLLVYSFVGDSQSVDEPVFEPWFALVLAIGFVVLLIIRRPVDKRIGGVLYRRDMELSEVADDPFRPA